MSDLSKLTKDEKEQLLRLLKEQDSRIRHNKLDSYFPIMGPLRLELYPKHKLFFEAGAIHKERAFIAGNRVGKTVAGAYEMVLHTTGLYPSWWKGKRFNEPVSCWAAGISNETVRDVLQKELLGNVLDIGTGLIPKDLIVGKPTSKPGVPNAIQDVNIRHISGGLSDISFKAYNQGREVFQGVAKHVIWLDEEPDDMGIYTECLTRTMTTKGIIYCTFTPLLGLSDVVMSFLPGGKLPPDGIVNNNLSEDL